jgi:NADH-quinone oxidoreductase subunit G
MVMITIYDDANRRKCPGHKPRRCGRNVGKEIPHYCYHPKLSVSGNCRMCLIEMGTPGRDRATGEPLLK